jgi:ornithine decarboxylase
MPKDRDPKMSDRDATPHFPDLESAVATLRPEEPLYCLRPRVLAAAARRFVAAFPGRVLYAVKANPLPAVLDGLHAGGVRHFDTASLGEIRLVKERFPEAGAYFMHPVKAPGAIRAAYRDYGVRHFVVDHADELVKLCAVLNDGDGRPPADVIAVVRLATPSEDSHFDLSTKFGATAEQAATLLRAVADSGARAGLCFHVGSQCLAPAAYTRALALAGEVIAAAEVPLACLDVGGGFPAPYAGVTPPPLDSYMAALRDGVARLGLPAETELLCEPGRALVAGGMALVVQVLLRKDDGLYLNDGIYGSLIGTSLGIRFAVRVIRPNRTVAAETREFTVYGPTCDGLDVLSYRLALPADTTGGDWIAFDGIGAYSAALRTDFNGFRPDAIAMLDGDEDATAAPPADAAAAG